MQVNLAGLRQFLILLIMMCGSQAYASSPIKDVMWTFKSHAYNLAKMLSGDKNFDSIVIDKALATYLDGATKLRDNLLLCYGAKAYLSETIEDGYGSVILDYGYDLSKPFKYSIDLQNRMVTLYQEKLDAIIPVLQFNEIKWRELREAQIITIKEV
jgi:hypothetical protein